MGTTKQFSLKSLLAGLTILCLILAWQASRMRRRAAWEAANHRISEIGGYTNSKSRTLEGVVLVNFMTDRVRDSDLDTLTKFPNLEYLWFSYGTAPYVTDVACKYLVSLPKLKELDLEGTAITDVGLMQLTSLRELRAIWLSGSQVTVDGVGAFQRSMPQVHIQTNSSSPSPHRILRPQHEPSPE